MGHLGLTPQSIYKFGTYTVRAKEEEEAEKLKKDAIVLQEAGCFGIVLEKIPASLGKRSFRTAYQYLQLVLAQAIIAMDRCW